RALAHIAPPREGDLRGVGWRQLVETLGGMDEAALAREEQASGLDPCSL
ncbi:MAG: hypothetical protein JO157_06055, partial [Acetobacteraceae bacterium]|nr:hypothetical protein [Acetobacteraceae bacterium]